MSTVSLACHQCQEKFEYPLKEYNRQSKKRQYFFCSLSCGTKWRNSTDKEIRKKMSRTMSIAMKGNTHGKKGDFTYYLNKARHRKKDMNLDEKFLKTLWDSQKGLCAISKVPIFLKTSQSHRSSPSTASLDRIDSSKDYIKGNVQFLAYSINLAKNSFSDQEILDFINSIPR